MSSSQHSNALCRNPLPFPHICDAYVLKAVFGSGFQSLKRQIICSFRRNEDHAALHKFSLKGKSLTELKGTARGGDPSKIYWTFATGVGQNQVTSRKGAKISSLPWCILAGGDIQGPRAMLHRKLQLLGPIKNQRALGPQQPNDSRQNLQMTCCIVEYIYHSGKKCGIVSVFLPKSVVTS